MLKDIETRDLQAVIAAVDAGRVQGAVTGASLSRLGLGTLASQLSKVEGLTAAGLRLAASAALAEREGKPQSPELVWTGPAGRMGNARSTEVVFRDLLASTQKSVWMTGYAVDHGKDLFAPLHSRMVEAQQSGQPLRVRFLLNLEYKRKEVSEPTLEASAQVLTNRFLESNWPLEGPRPEFYYDPRTIDPKVFASMHAKTVVVDERRTLIGSANFTNRGQTRNIEAGAVIDDPTFARSLVSQLQSLIDAGKILRSI